MRPQRCASIHPKGTGLDILIALTKHIGETRSELHNFQLGVQLLRGLNYSLQFPTFSHVGMYSPTLLSAICDGDEAVLKTHGALFGYESCAANLGLSVADPALEGATHRAMDRLEIGRRGRGQSFRQRAAFTVLSLQRVMIPAFSINLKSDEDRFERISRSLRAICGIKAKRVDGVYGSSLADDVCRRLTGDPHSIVAKGAVGCFLSHVRA